MTPLSAPPPAPAHLAPQDAAMRMVAAWRAVLEEQVPDAGAAILSTTARILANRLSSPDLLLKLADLLREAAAEIATPWATSLRTLAELLALEAPNRAAPDPQADHA